MEIQVREVREVDTVKKQEQLRELRAVLSQAITMTRTLAEDRQPQVGPEITIAARHLEDARMRLGVALAYEVGLDPWSSDISNKED